MTVAPASTPLELSRGTTLGKYEILRRMETGGMAEIYLARARGTGGFEKVVVLKRILPTLAHDQRIVAMFLDEARLAASLQHPNIADVYDVGEANGAYFFTMEFVYGQNVRTIRRAAHRARQPISLDIALAIVHGTAEALGYAHDHTTADGRPLGLVHRDVTPSNIVVSYDGAVKLVDFGIARAALQRHETRTGSLKGKIPYMSPEQCKTLPLDRRSDLFSLGVVLYELTVGARPFRGANDFEVMDQIINRPLVPPHELAPGYPADLEAIVVRSLQQSPSERYASADEMLHDLDDVIANHHVRMSPRITSKYMRALFADRLAESAQAEERGVSFSQRMVRALTSDSHPSDSVMPRSTDHTSELGSADLMSASAELDSGDLVSVSDDAVLESVGTRPLRASGRVPAAPRAHSGRALWIALSAILVASGGIAAYWLLSPAVATDPAPRAPARRVEMVVTPPAVTPAPEPSPPAPTPPPVPAPAPPLAVPSGDSQRPIAPPHPAPPRRITKPAAPPPHHPRSPATPQQPAEETPWDPNSPYLPQ